MLIVRNARDLGGAPVDFAVEQGQISALPQRRGAALEIDATGATVLPGLHDHHLHILATAARRQSLDLAGCTTAGDVEQAIRGSRQPVLRAVGYDELAAGLLDRSLLDQWSPDKAARVQDRTGALWVLNSAALAMLPTTGLPTGAERDPSGRLTGRFWREDRWLSAHNALAPAELAELGLECASYGLTGLTDAGWTNGPAAAKTLGEAHTTAALPQRLTLMGDESLPQGPGYRVGPLKLMLDERDLPTPERLAGRIGEARRQGRAVAAHCVTAAELALYLAALDLAGGVRGGDRVEHGGMIPDPALSVIAATLLTVVTNPAFVHDRGDRYRATVPAAAWSELYRAAALQSAGIPLAAGSDAPYATADPWLGMRAARDRLTAQGHSLGLSERLTAHAALGLYLGGADDPGGPARRVAPGQPADFVLCDGSPADVLADLTPDRVRFTAIAGEIAFSRASAASSRR